MNKNFEDLVIGDKIYLKDEDIKELEIENIVLNGNLQFNFKKNESIYKMWILNKCNFCKDFIIYPSDRFNHIYISTSMDKLLLEVLQEV